MPMIAIAPDLFGIEPIWVASNLAANVLANHLRLTFR